MEPLDSYVIFFGFQALHAAWQRCVYHFATRSCLLLVVVSDTQRCGPSWLCASHFATQLYSFYSLSFQVLHATHYHGALLPTLPHNLYLLLVAIPSTPRYAPSWRCASHFATQICSFCSLSFQVLHATHYHGVAVSSSLRYAPPWRCASHFATQLSSLCSLRFQVLHAAHDHGAVLPSAQHGADGLHLHDADGDGGALPGHPPAAEGQLHVDLREDPPRHHRRPPLLRHLQPAQVLRQHPVQPLPLLRLVQRRVPDGAIRHEGRERLALAGKPLLFVLLVLLLVLVLVFFLPRLG